LASQVRVAEDVAGAFNVRVTFTVLVIPPPVTVTMALLLPRLAVEVFTLAVIVPLLDPEAGLMVNQLASSLTVQVPLDAIDIA
jgi:hypothetical protein